MKKYLKVRETLALKQNLTTNRLHIDEGYVFTDAKKFKQSHFRKAMDKINNPKMDIECYTIYREDKENRHRETWVDFDYSTTSWNWFLGKDTETLEEERVVRNQISNLIATLFEDASYYQLFWEKEGRVLYLYNVSNDEWLPDIALYFDERTEK